jgi:hypothetical protein
MDQLVKRFGLKMRLHKITVSPVYQCALLVGFLNRSGHSAEIVQGYITLGNQAVRHYWVQADGSDIDIVTQLSKTPIPFQLERTIDETVEVRQEGNLYDSQFELYTTNAKEFWKERAQCLRNFKI